MNPVPFAVALLLSSGATAQTTGPAPAGDAKAVATRVIADAEHPCPRVVGAVRNSDGSISAVCSNKEDYRVFSVKGDPVAMRCSAARKLGVRSC